jgi:iron complex outermembrane receptor protein
VDTGDVVDSVNVGDSKEQGVEVTASGKLVAGLTWHGDYTYTDIKDSPNNGLTALANASAYAQTTPRHRGNVGLDWVTGPWEADVNLHYVGRYMSPNLITPGTLVTVGGYGSLSSRIGYRFAGDVTVAVSGQNLLSPAQAQTTGLRADREAQLTISKAW